MNFSTLKLRSGRDLDLCKQEQLKLKEQAQEATTFIDEIKKGNFKYDVSAKLGESELGSALTSMKIHLAKIAREEETRNWLNAGLATFSDILRNKKSLSLKDLTDDILMNLVKYIQANQGALFVLDGDEQNKHLTMLSCYAYNRKKFMDKRIELGEGMAGQCVLEREVIYLKDVPANYVRITSGLGEATPREVLISPLIINESVFGVIELASLGEFLPHHREFVSKLSENIAATIKSVKDSERTLQLLNASQQQAEELRSQEEEMRQNMEEMQATQEEMKRKSDELNAASAEMSGIIAGINATMATIEFTPDGTIITANDNFLKSVKYGLDQIKGRHHRIFVPDEIIDSSDYKTFWSRLAAGEAITGTFKRVSSTGGTIWLNAIYNPIRNARGAVVKVIKFATDITAEQQLLAETKGILEGINATMATIEFKPDGTIINANENFLKSMKYSLEEIKGKHHKMFAPKEVRESEDYKTFWARLAQGESIKGVFKRVSSTGDTVWLNAIYNPIADANGKIVKVVKFATDITTQQEAIAETQGILKGIDTTMATIEFAPDGTILHANHNFLKSVKYELHEVKGKHHKVFVPKETADSPDYKTFWQQLASGKASSGVFKRVSSKGDTILLNAIYNPIKNANGDVVKVVKLATDISHMSERVA